METEKKNVKSKNLLLTFNNSYLYVLMYFILNKTHICVLKNYFFFTRLLNLVFLSILPQYLQYH